MPADNAIGRIDTMPQSTIEALLALAEKSDDLLALLNSNSGGGTAGS